VWVWCVRCTDVCVVYEREKGEVMKIGHGSVGPTGVCVRDKDVKVSQSIQK